MPNERVQIELVLTAEEVAELKRVAEEWNSDTEGPADFTWQDVLTGIASNAVKGRIGERIQERAGALQ